MNFDNYRPNWATSLLIGTAATLGAVWYSRKEHYWKRRNIPYATHYPIVGSAYAQFRKPIHDIEIERYNKFGRVYGHYCGSTPLISVGDPLLLDDILNKDFQYFINRPDILTGDNLMEYMMSFSQDDDWKRLRNIVTKAFTPEKLRNLAETFRNCSEILVENFKEYALDKPVDVKKVYDAYTMDVIAKAGFSYKMDSYEFPTNPFVIAMRKASIWRLNWRFQLFLFSPSLLHRFGFHLISPAALAPFQDLTRRIIKVRRKKRQPRNDFLQTLMDAEVTDKNLINSLKSSKKTELLRLTTDELVAQCVNFFIAGFDTILTTLSCATYFIATNPNFQEDTFNKVAEILDKYGGRATNEALDEMQHIDNIILETLRLYPPAARIERVCNADYELGNTGITIPKGMIVTIPICAIHRDEDIYPDANTFSPYRHNIEDENKPQSCSFLPFGVGNRHCVAMNFSHLAIKTCLVYVIATFKISTCKKTKVPLQLRKRYALTTPKDVFLQLELRENSPLEENYSESEDYF